jgi:four helix bundle protein
MSENERYPEAVESETWWGVSDGGPGPTREKSYRFALVIIDLFKRLEERREYVISKQLLKSGTSIGANVVEASAAESRRDFVHKMAIASKEARETSYWLQLLSESDLAPGIDVSTELELVEELIRLLTSIVKTASQQQ